MPKGFAKSDNLLAQLREGDEFSRGNQLKLVWLLSIPVILAQVTSIIMQYIDASMVGSLGAGKYELTRKLARMAVLLGVIIMAIAGAAMFFAAPFMMSVLTPDTDIRDLGTQVLRIEVFAEPMYAASIVVSGALRGVGDTMVPSIMNFASIWFVRLPLAILLSGRLGLRGVWIAMCAELCFRGGIFLIRLYREHWLPVEK